MASLTPLAARPAAPLQGQVQRPDSSIDQSEMARIAITVARVAASIIIPILSLIFLPLPIALAITGVVIRANLVDCLSKLVPPNEEESRVSLSTRRTMLVRHMDAYPADVVHISPPGISLTDRRYWTDARPYAVEGDPLAARLSVLAASAGLRSRMPAAMSVHRRDDTLYTGDGPHVGVGQDASSPMRRTSIRAVPMCSASATVISSRTHFAAPGSRDASAPAGDSALHVGVGSRRATSQ